MFGCAELEEYLKTPIRERTPELRSEAYGTHIKQSIRWWESFLKRNPDIDPNHSLDRIGKVSEIIRELKVRLAAL